MHFLLLLPGLCRYSVLVLTKTPDQEEWTANERAGEEEEPDPSRIPDTKECCRRQNVTHQR